MSITCDQFILYLESLQNISHHQPPCPSKCIHHKHPRLIQNAWTRLVKGSGHYPIATTHPIPRLCKTCCYKLVTITDDLVLLFDILDDIDSSTLDLCVFLLQCIFDHGFTKIFIFRRKELLIKILRFLNKFLFSAERTKHLIRKQREFHLLGDVMGLRTPDSPVHSVSIAAYSRLLHFLSSICVRLFRKCKTMCFEKTIHPLHEFPEKDYIEISHGFAFEFFLMDPNYFQNEYCRYLDLSSKSKRSINIFVDTPTVFKTVLFALGFTNQYKHLLDNDAVMNGAAMNGAAMSMHPMVYMRGKAVYRGKNGRQSLVEEPIFSGCFGPIWWAAGHSRDCIVCRDKAEKEIRHRFVAVGSQLICQNAHCNRTSSEMTLKLCKGCKMIYYCSRRCQKKDWKARHSLHCKK